MAVKDEATTTKLSEAAKFRVNVKLVLARVVVLDIRGHAVGNLHKEDFELLDNGKPQVISNFDSEQTTSLNSATPVAAAPSSTEAAKTAESATLPSRYVAYLFDDLHLNFENINAVRAAAERRMETLAPPIEPPSFQHRGRRLSISRTTGANCIKQWKLSVRDLRSVERLPSARLSPSTKPISWRISATLRPCKRLSTTTCIVPRCPGARGQRRDRG